MNSDLTARLRKKFEFSKKAALGAACDSPFQPITSDFAFGALWEHTRLKPLHDCLLECVEALEQIDIEWCQHPGMSKVDEHRQWCSACTEWIYPDEKNPAREALDKITRLVE